MRSAVNYHRRLTGLVSADHADRRQAALYAAAEIIRGQADEALAVHEAARAAWSAACKQRNAAYTAARRLRGKEQTAAFAALPAQPEMPPDRWPAILAARAVAAAAKSRADAMTGGYIAD